MEDHLGNEIRALNSQISQLVNDISLIGDDELRALARGLLRDKRIICINLQIRAAELNQGEKQ